jgi:phosphoglycerate kinase
MNLPSLSSINISEKRVILRMDFDLPENADGSLNTSRIESSKETLDYLLAQNAKLILIGHMGRPEGKPSGELSLSKLVEPLKQITGRDVDFFYAILGQETTDKVNAMQPGQIMLLENLRFDAREEANDEGFAQELAQLGEVYVNESFGVSHRSHTSIAGIPKFLPHAAGMRFAKEIEVLSKLRENPERPFVSLLSGVKKDKLDYLEPFKSFSDKVLVSGRLPEYLGDEFKDEKVVVAKLMPDKEDITINSIEKFEEEIAKAKTVLVAGPVGKYEEEGHKQGTQRVLTAVANSTAYKIAGGGDTEDALHLLSLKEKFNWISVGGGAMLEFLSKGTLPGIEALLH